MGVFAVSVNCQDCGACCELLYFELSHLTRHQAALASEFYSARSCYIRRTPTKGGFFDMEIFVKAPCQLLKDKKCLMYEARPEACRNFAIDSVMCRKCREITKK